MSIVRALIHHSTAFGLASGLLRFEEDRAVLAFLHQLVASLVSACQRLLPLGQTAATRILWNLKPTLIQTAQRSVACSLDDACSFTPLLDWAAMGTSALSTSLFVSSRSVEIMISARDADAGCENRAASLQSGRVHAALNLDFALDPVDPGRTILNVSQQDPPLKVVRAFALADGSALAHLHNVSGGLLGGDKLALSVRVGAGARVQLTTTGATRVYRPREEASPVSQISDITVGENALLEYVPDAIVPFAGARYSQRTTVRLAAGAGLFWWEILAPGREAHGEIFEYECVEMKTDVLALGGPSPPNEFGWSRSGGIFRSIPGWVPLATGSAFISAALAGSNAWLVAERGCARSRKA